MPAMEDEAQMPNGKQYNAVQEEAFSKLLCHLIIMLFAQ
jgi:hypothetical protein